MSRVMLEEAGVEIEEDISVKQPRLSQARFYPTSVKTLRPTTPNHAQLRLTAHTIYNPRPRGLGH